MIRKMQSIWFGFYRSVMCIIYFAMLGTFGYGLYSLLKLFGYVN